MAPMQTTPAHERVLARSVESAEVFDGLPCWVFQGATGQHGHGVVRVGSMKDGTRRQVGAHRAVYAALVGEIPPGLELDHLCRNATCVNPWHLEPVTHRVNVLRGESPSARHARKTHCPQGHEYTKANTYVYQGTRQCVSCKRRRDLNRAR